ncbi:MAG: AAA family ATPase [Bacteroidales bacterium]|nr:AAA family ATPase [Bacteroidales bacterium]
MKNEIEVAAINLAIAFSIETDIPVRYRKSKSLKKKKLDESSRIELNFKEDVERWELVIKNILEKIEQDQVWRFINLIPRIEPLTVTATKCKDFIDFTDYFVKRRDVENCGPEETGRLAILHTSFQRKINDIIDSQQFINFENDIKQNIMEPKTENIKTVETFETEVKKYVEGLPYWAKYLADKILSGNAISDKDIDTSYNFLLEELELVLETEKPEISLIYNPEASDDYKENLIFNVLQNVEGVNALAEKQTIEFSPNLTIIYGANGAGKSGYVRLFKNTFYSKDMETILENINLAEGHKPIYAEFNFSSNGEIIPLKYPQDLDNGIFNQFAVFDGEIGRRHLRNRNDFSFRPAGLTLFAEFNSALEKLQSKLLSEIQLKPIHNPFSDDDIFPGESIIKTFLSSLDHNSKLDELKKQIPFTEEDKIQKTKIDKEYDDLKIALSQKDKELKSLRDIKKQLAGRKQNLDTINKYFNQVYLDSVRISISDCKTKLETAKKEGIENFATDKIKNVGIPEWKHFIDAAEKFALKQKKEDEVYPVIGDHCLLCYRPIEDEQQKLILSYWDFIKSIVEQVAKEAKESLEKIREGFEKLNLNQFFETDTLTVWLKEKHNDILDTLNQTLSNQKELLINIISDIETKETKKRTAIQLDLTKIDAIDKEVDALIKTLEEDEQNTELAKLLKKKDYLLHKEKLQLRFTEIEELYQNMVWINKANNFSKQSWKRHSTETEKRLSKKYFNEKYIQTFNDECITLDGDFGIDVDAKSSEGQSNRQLFLKGRNPSSVLSEGEQKVISLADFLTEIKLSSINKGIIIDDPVTSLDHDRKDVIAERLVKEAQKRQVIILTHDIVFMSMIVRHAYDSTLEFYAHWIKKILDGTPGIIEHHQNPKLSNLASLKKDADEGLNNYDELGEKDKERTLGVSFDYLRSACEAMVREILFAGTIKRYDDHIRMQNIEEMPFDQGLALQIVELHGKISELGLMHDRSDKMREKLPGIGDWNKVRKEFEELELNLKALRKQARKERIERGKNLAKESQGWL